MATLENDPLTPDQRAALDALVPPESQSGVLVDDLATAAREAMRRRVVNSQHGGEVIVALHNELRSWRALEDMTGIDVNTARRWITPPPGAAGPASRTRARRPSPAAITTTEALVTESASKPEAQPVVAAVVTSDRGMLVTWRNDKTPPAGFLTGEIEPGESPEDAMTREVKEECGLRVTAGAVLGRRVHPRTLKTMIYVAGAPVDGAEEIFVGDEVELSAVKWVDLATADEAFAPFGGMFPPVHEYLVEVLGK